MLDFMDHVQQAFYEASHWNVDNSYGALNATARGTSDTYRYACWSRILTNSAHSSARLPDPEGIASPDFFACGTQLCEFLYAK